MDLFLALLPALVMIALVIITRKVLLSLGIGVVLAAFIFSQWNIVDTIVYIWASFFGIVTSWDWYLPILGFVVIIGGITAVITLTGGVRAFANWAVSKVKNPVAAQIMTWVLGIIICIDDYFNALVIGEVSKPITDQYKVSRAKLAYIIDTTSAPVVILMPISTWGAYLIGLLGEQFSENGYTTHNGLTGLIASLPYQFYAFTAIIFVFLIVIFRINLGAMKKYENATLEGEDISRSPAAKEVSTFPVIGTKATHWNLIVPILVLVFITLFTMFAFAGFGFSSFMDQDITIPLFFGGVSAFLTAVIFALFDRGIKIKTLAAVSGRGMLAMFKSAVAILVLAWMVSNALQDLEAGDLIAVVIDDANIPIAILPIILFVIAGGVAFATGTSWGTFGILLPIAIPIAITTNPEFMPVILAAVLGGAVFGDHSSPISDTTVLSATGAQSALHAHFISQLPYTLICAGLAAAAYLMFWLTQILFLSYIVLIVGLGLLVKFLKKG